MIIKPLFCLTLITIFTGCTLHENQARKCINKKAVAFAKGAITEDEDCGLEAVSATACPSEMTAYGTTQAQWDESTEALVCATDVAEIHARLTCLWEFPLSLIFVDLPAANTKLTSEDEQGLILETMGTEKTQIRFQKEVEKNLYNYCVLETASSLSSTDESLDALLKVARTLIGHRP